MRNAETALSIIRDRGKRGLPLEDIYRQLYNPELYLSAYARLYSNDGAMTKGTTDETVDAMSRRKIQPLISELRQKEFRWTPVRRIHIPKKKGTRPLGIPSWRDKLLQEVIRSILEEYYEPQLSNASHGFRPGARWIVRPKRRLPFCHTRVWPHSGKVSNAAPYLEPKGESGQEHGVKSPLKLQSQKSEDGQQGRLW